MALPPPVPARPDDRPETFEEYRARRELIALHRKLNDEVAAYLARGGRFEDLFDFDLFGRSERG